jgi:hypothetical protein
MGKNHAYAETTDKELRGVMPNRRRQKLSHGKADHQSKTYPQSLHYFLRIHWGIPDVRKGNC